MTIRRYDRSRRSRFNRENQFWRQARESHTNGWKPAWRKIEPKKIKLDKEDEDLSHLPEEQLYRLGELKLTKEPRSEKAS